MGTHNGGHDRQAKTTSSIRSCFVSATHTPERPEHLCGRLGRNPGAIIFHAQGTPPVLLSCLDKDHPRNRVPPDVFQQRE